MKIKELEAQISDLNTMLLEQKDQINRLGAQKDHWRKVVANLILAIEKEFSEDVATKIVNDNGILTSDQQDILYYEMLQDNYETEQQKNQ